MKAMDDDQDDDDEFDDADYDHGHVCVDNHRSNELTTWRVRAVTCICMCVSVYRPSRFPCPSSFLLPSSAVPSVLLSSAHLAANAAPANTREATQVLCT